MTRPTQPEPDRSDLGNSLPITPQVSSFPLPASTALTLTPNPNLFAFGTNFNDTSTKKRSAFNDLEGEGDKRVKSSHEPESSASIPSSTPSQDQTPHSNHTLSATGRMTAGDYINNTPMADTLAHPSTAASHTPALVAPPQSSLDAKADTKIGTSIPPVPLEAIETLQQASSDMLKALVKKDAKDREKQLMVAVGTMRACLEIDFVPHMEVWKENAEVDKAILPSQVNLMEQTRNLSTNTSKPPPGTTTGPRETNPFGIGPPREVLRTQLSEAQATLRKQEQVIRDKDAEIAKSKEEIERLSTQLVQAKKTRAKQPIVSQSMNDMNKVEPAIIALNKVITEQQLKIANHQKINNDLKNQIAQLKLKKKVARTGPPSPGPRRNFGKKARGVARQGHLGVVRQGGGRGSIWRAESREAENTEDPTTPRERATTGSSASVGPTLLRSHGSISVTPVEEETTNHAAGLDIGTNVSPGMETGTGSNRLAIGPQSHWATYLGQQEVQGQEIKIKQEELERQEDEPEQGKGKEATEEQVESGNGGTKDGNVDDPAGGSRQSLWDKFVIQPAVDTSQDSGLRNVEGQQQGQRQGQGQGQGIGQDHIGEHGQGQAEAGPSSCPPGSMFFSYSAGRNGKETGSG